MTIFADDIAVFAENENNLQTLLDCIHKWCSQWRLKINPNKTNIVHFRKQSQEKTRFNFNIGGTQLEIKESYKYLGCILSETLDFTVTATALADSAGRALGSLINKYRMSDGLPFSVYEKLYYCCIVPIMDYNAGIWGYKSYPKCDTIQNRAIRTYLGVHRRASNLAIHGDVAWLEPSVRRKIEMLRIWARLVQMDDSRITKRVFLWDYNQPHGWCADIKKVFNSINLNNLYDSLSVGGFTTRSLLQFANSKLEDAGSNQWKEEILKQPKLRTYVQIKDQYTCENYVTMNMSRSLRSFIAQIRCGILPLHIETGRFRNLKPEERLCPVCDGPNNVETEFHFLFDCVAYMNHRLTFYNWIIKTHPNFISFNHAAKLKIMLSDKRVIQKSALFIQNCYLLRTNKLFL